MITRAIPLFLLVLPALARAQAPAASPQSFPTAQDAAQALIRAAEAKDGVAILSVLGPGAKDLFDTGDAAADAQHLERFAHEAQAAHRLVPNPVRAGELTLVVGEKEWPFPVPIVKSQGGWRFDAAEGRKETLARVIGRNEITAIEISRAYVEAQREYASERRIEGQPRQYAQRIVSSPGKKDGLYWPVAEGDPPSPAGEIFARMSTEIAPEKGKPKIFHGYRFRVLKAQGKHAPGGARDYVAKGFMIGGFALVAFPIEYGVTGLTTFIVSQDGVVYEKDLGPKTVEVATKMKTFDPGAPWRRAP
jgi:hypothetical protein